MRSIAVFARPPVPGLVKTRLSPALPPALACDLSRAMLEDTLELVAGAEADRRFLYWADPVPAGAGIEVPAAFEPRLQRGDDLGARLARAFDELLRRPADRAIVIGADCPGLRASFLEEALHAIETRDLVLGPTADGGYYLIGLGHPAPMLFRDVAWSSGAVLEQTRARAGQAGLSMVELRELEDLDTPADLAVLVARTLLQERGGPGRHTTAALATIGLLPHR